MGTDSHVPSKVSRQNATIAAVLIVAVASMVIGGIGLVTYGFSYLQICAGPSSSIHFTIIMTDQGFNGSKTHIADPWPIMNVTRCQVVTVHLENLDTAESHGFAITHYLDSGVQLRPGQTDDVTFTANRAGSFLVYCNVLCSIHLYMQNGRLNVT